MKLEGASRFVAEPDPKDVRSIAAIEVLDRKRVLCPSRGRFECLGGGLKSAFGEK